MIYHKFLTNISVYYFAKFLYRDIETYVFFHDTRINELFFRLCIMYGGVLGGRDLISYSSEDMSLNEMSASAFLL